MKKNKADASYVYFRTNINLSFSHAQMNALFQPNWALLRGLLKKNFEMKLNENQFEMHRFFQKTVMNERKNNFSHLRVLKQPKFEFWPVKLNSGQTFFQKSF